MSAVTIETGIQRFSWGYRARVEVSPYPAVTESFSLDTELKAIREWRESERKRLRKQKKEAAHEDKQRAPKPGTLAKAIAHYTPLIASWSDANRKDRLRLLAKWVEKLGGDRQLDSITDVEIGGILQAWLGSGWSPGYCKTFRTALMAVYTAVNGKGGANPVRAVKPFKEDDLLPRGRDRFELDRLIRAVKPSKARAACWVKLWTGMRPAELRAAQPEHLDLRGKSVLVPTKKHGAARLVPLTRQAVEAWREFERLEMWGHVPRHSGCEAWLKRHLPFRMRVYDLRHTYGTGLALEGASDTQIAELMGHRSIRLVRRYTLAALKIGAVLMTKKLEGAGPRRSRKPRKVAA